MRLIFALLAIFPFVAANALTLEEQIDVLVAAADLQFDINTKPVSEYQTEPAEGDWTTFHRLQQAITARMLFLQKLEQQGVNRYVIVNRSEYVLRVVENGTQVIEERVVVGRKSRRTPLLTSSIQNVILNPYWNVPHGGKTQGDVIRKVLKLATQQERVDYLQYKKYRFFRANVEVSPWNIDFTRFPGDIKIRQDPSDVNSLGRVKFLFPNRYSVYIHDTPTKNLFDKNEREFSSGCIRLQNPDRLAAYLLGKSRDTVQSLMSVANPRESWHKVQPLPIYIVDGDGWETYVDEDGNVRFKE